MSRVLNGCISIILLLSLAMGIYCAGTKRTYDFKVHLESISQVAQEMPTIEELGFIWEADIIENGLMGAGPGGSYRKVIHLKRWPAYGAFKAAYSSDTGAYWYPFVESSISSGSNAYTPIADILDGVHQFTARTVYTFIWIGNYAGSFFDLVFALSPTSGIVAKGGNA